MLEKRTKQYNKMTALIATSAHFQALHKYADECRKYLEIEEDTQLDKDVIKKAHEIRFLELIELLYDMDINSIEQLETYNGGDAHTVDSCCYLLSEVERDYHKRTAKHFVKKDYDECMKFNNSMHFSITSADLNQIVTWSRMC
jgi:hypothetical protein